MFVSPFSAHLFRDPSCLRVARRATIFCQAINESHMPPPPIFHSLFPPDLCNPSYQPGVLKLLAIEAAMEMGLHLFFLDKFHAHLKKWRKNNCH